MNLQRYNKLIKTCFDKSVQDNIQYITEGKIDNIDFNISTKDYIVSKSVDSIINQNIESVTKIRPTEYNKLVSFISINEDITDSETLKSEIKEYLTENAIQLSETLSQTIVKPLNLSYNQLKNVFYTNIAPVLINEAKTEFSINEFDNLTIELFVDKDVELKMILEEFNSMSHDETLNESVINEGFIGGDKTVLRDIITNITHAYNFSLTDELRTYCMWIMGDWMRWNKTGTESFESIESFTESVKIPIKKHLHDLSLQLKRRADSKYNDAFITQKGVFFLDFKKSVPRSLNKLLPQLRQHLQNLVNGETPVSFAVITEISRYTMAIQQISEKNIKHMNKLVTSTNKTIKEALNYGLESFACGYAKIILEQLKESGIQDTIPKFNAMEIILREVLDVEYGILRGSTIDAILNEMIFEVFKLYSMADDKYDLDFYNYDEVMSWTNDVAPEHLIKFTKDGHLEYDQNGEVVKEFKFDKKNVSSRGVNSLVSRSARKIKNGIMDKYSLTSISNLILMHGFYILDCQDSINTLENKKIDMQRNGKTLKGLQKDILNKEIKQIDNEIDGLIEKIDKRNKISLELRDQYQQMFDDKKKRDAKVINKQLDELKVFNHMMLRLNDVYEKYQIEQPKWLKAIIGKDMRIIRESLIVKRENIMTNKKNIHVPIRGDAIAELPIDPVTGEEIFTYSREGLSFEGLLPYMFIDDEKERLKAKAHYEEIQRWIDVDVQIVSENGDKNTDTTVVVQTMPRQKTKDEKYSEKWDEIDKDISTNVGDSNFDSTRAVNIKDVKKDSNYWKDADKQIITKKGDLNVDSTQVVTPVKR